MCAKFRSLASAVLSDGELDAVEGAVVTSSSTASAALIAAISAVGVR